MTKYKAKPIVIDGIRFASQKEGRRYQELRLLEKAGEITSLCLQPSYSLEVDAQHKRVDARRHVIGLYRGDFAYFDRAGKEIIEDVKGFKTPLYRWKKKHVEAQYGVQIVEI